MLGLRFSESLDDIDKFMHGPVLEIIEIVSLSAELYEFLWVVARFDDILAEVVLFVLEIMGLHLLFIYLE